MLRRLSIPLGGLQRGTKPLKKRNAIQVTHAAVKPPMPDEIDFSSLDLKFMPSEIDVKVKSTVWSQPPESPPSLPFHVQRSTIGKSLPVYSDFTHGRTKVITMLTKISGDINILQSEMSKVVDNRRVQVKPGKLIVDGNYVRRVKRWLAGLGF